MLKKIIQILAILTLVAILALIVIAIFNPFHTRDKIVGGIINGYLGSSLENYTPLENKASAPATVTSTTDNSPLLNTSQEKALENLGVNVSQLPTEVTPAMQECLVNAVGQDRAGEIIAGDTPTALDILKARNCLK